MSTLKNIGRPRVDDKKVVEGFVVKNNKIIFGGRLGQYKYYDMDVKVIQ